MRRLLPVLSLCLLVGCAGFGPPCAFVRSDRAFANRVFPDYRRYLEADPELAPELRTSKLELLAKWERALADREARCGEEVTR